MDEEEFLNYHPFISKGKFATEETGFDNDQIQEHLRIFQERGFINNPTFLTTEGHTVICQVEYTERGKEIISNYETMYNILRTTININLSNNNQTHNIDRIISYLLENEYIKQIGLTYITTPKGNVFLNYLNNKLGNDIK